MKELILISAICLSGCAQEGVVMGESIKVKTVEDTNKSKSYRKDIRLLKKGANPYKNGGRGVVIFPSK